MTPVRRLTLPEQTASQAELIVNSLQETKYQHHEVIDVDRGKYDCDCSAFVSFVLNRSAPAHFAMIPKEAAPPRPRAFEFHDFFHALTSQSTGGWHRINFLQDVVRGDIIAWRLLKIVPYTHVLPSNTRREKHIGRSHNPWIIYNSYDGLSTILLLSHAARVPPVSLRIAG